MSQILKNSLCSNGCYTQRNKHLKKKSQKMSNCFVMVFVAFFIGFVCVNESQM